MSQENVETATVGRLLCAIGNASAHVWVLQGFDVFLYEHGVAAVRVTASETQKAFSTRPWTLGPRPGIAERGSARKCLNGIPRIASSRAGTSRGRD
jgi:hypothetical protein